MRKRMRITQKYIHGEDEKRPQLVHFLVCTNDNVLQKINAVTNKNIKPDLRLSLSLSKSLLDCIVVIPSVGKSEPMQMAADKNSKIS